MDAENFSLGGFTEKLASSAPTPGGGGAAAMCAALSVSLCSMAANLTIGKKKFAGFEDDHRRIIDDCEALRKRSLRLIDLDAELFAPLSELYSMPKGSENYAERLKEATLNAAKAPMMILELCADAAILLTEMREKCSALLLSDIGCAAALCNAAAACAAMNVYVNTRTLKGDTIADGMSENTARLLSEVSEKMTKLTENISERLRGK